MTSIVPPDPFATLPSAPAPVATVPAPTAFNTRVLYVAAGFAALVLVCAVALGIGESAENKMTLFKWAVTSAGGVLATALAAMGYQTGKLFEGTTPAGFVPSAKAVAEVVASELAAAKKTTTIPFAPVLALLMLPLFVCGGCVGTSAQFKVAAPAGVNAIVADMKDYTAQADWDANHNGAVDPNEAAAQAAEVALTEKFAASVADPKTVTVEGVESAWRPVESLWRKYVSADPTLDTPEDRKIRNDTGDALNRLIQVEKNRQAALKSSLGLSAIFGGSSVPPSTQPVP